MNNGLQVPTVQLISLEDADSSLLMVKTRVEIIILCSERDILLCKSIEEQWHMFSAVCSIILVLSLSRLETCLEHAVVAFQLAQSFSFPGNLKMLKQNLNKMMLSWVMFCYGVRISVECTSRKWEEI